MLSLLRVRLRSIIIMFNNEKVFMIFLYKITYIREHSITTWTRRGGEGVSRMSTGISV